MKKIYLTRNYFTVEAPLYDQLGIEVLTLTDLNY
jgi:hypothetical protein